MLPPPTRLHRSARPPPPTHFLACCEPLLGHYQFMPDLVGPRCPQTKLLNPEHQILKLGHPGIVPYVLGHDARLCLLLALYGRRTRRQMGDGLDEAYRFREIDLPTFSDPVLSTCLWPLHKHPILPQPNQRKFGAGREVGELLEHVVRAC